MGLTFAYPAFLWALAALAIPVIIHLFSFRRYKTVFFPNVAFLREVKQQTDSRTRVKHWLVLLSRVLLLAFLVLAFAQPSVRKDNAAVRTGKSAVSIYVDNSFSMQQTDAEQTLLERARKRAYDVLDAYGPDD
ncbi:MAG TPA: BatA domain-containing protein, partial [Chitinophagales bacterium]|nr:BatA domain-containing protein [Chitinophagales bacterium]